MGNGNKRVHETTSTETEETTVHTHHVMDIVYTEVDTLIAQDKMSVILFYSKTCGPCVATTPHYEAASNFFVSKTNNIQFAKITAWDPPEQMEYCKQKWDVAGVPHIKIFYQGHLINDRKGGCNLDTLKDVVKESIDKVFKQHRVKV